MFFGMIRQSCGGNDHPTASQFLYAYRLLSANSLIKPPRRASVTTEPAKILAPLARTTQTDSVSKESVRRIEQHIDNMLQHGNSGSDSDTETDSDIDLLMSVECDDSPSDPEKCIVNYLSGYVAHKLRKFTSCADCLAVLVSDQATSDSTLISLKTRGGLQIPSKPLSDLIGLVEQCVQKHSSKLHVNSYTMMLNEVLAADELASATVGCQVHSVSLTSRCIHFYVVTRLYFLRKARNRNRKAIQQKHKLSKLSKLT